MAGLKISHVISTAKHIADLRRFPVFPLLTFYTLIVSSFIFRPVSFNCPSKFARQDLFCGCRSCNQELSPFHLTRYPFIRAAMCFNFPEKLCTVSIYRVCGDKFKVLLLKSMAKIKKHQGSLFSHLSCILHTILFVLELLKN